MCRNLKTSHTFVLVCTLAGSLAARAQPPLQTADEAAWFQNVRQLTKADMGLDRSGEAYFSRDGQRVCFQAYPRGQTDYQIYVMNLDGSGLQMVSTGKGATTCAYFSPDGTRLLFASNHVDPRPVETPEEARAAAEKAGRRDYRWSFYPGMDLFEFTFATGQLRQLTRAAGYDAEGSYSPDGKRIVFSSMRDGDQEIYICDADGGNERRITKMPGYDGGPFFSPDGQRIVYRSDRRATGNMQIFVNNLEGTAEQSLTGDDVLNWCPFWHPSGKWLIFTRADHGTADNPTRPNYDLYLLAADGARTVRLTTDPTFDGLPVFSPDGRKLMWTSKRGGLDTPQVFVADFVGLSPSGELRAADNAAKQ